MVRQSTYVQLGYISTCYQITTNFSQIRQNPEPHLWQGCHSCLEPKTQIAYSFSQYEVNKNSLSAHEAQSSEMLGLSRYCEHYDETLA